MKVRIELATPIDQKKLADITKGHLRTVGTAPIHAITTDSRLVKEGDLFVALRGERIDGHLFLQDARERGAVLLLTEKECDGGLLVHDTRAALSALAAERTAEANIPIIAITGSVGKTGTKEAVAATLATRFRVHKTKGNLNNDLGVAYTLLACPRNAEVLVLEFGTSNPGEIGALAKVAPPTIAILTAIGTAHIGSFGTQEAILREKASLLDRMQGGLAILNGDDRLLRTLSPTIPAHWVGTQGDAHLTATRILGSRHGTSYTLTHDGVPLRRIFLRSAGRPQVYASLFAIDAALHLGVPLDSAADAVFRMKNEGGRQSIVYTDGVLLIDDAYNSSPEAMQEALTLLTDVASGARRFAAIGDMLELGDMSEELHRAVGYRAAECTDFLLAFGSYATAVAEGARENGMPPERILCLSDAEECAYALLPLLTDGDAVLVKASHAMGAEAICEAVRLRALHPRGPKRKK